MFFLVIQSFKFYQLKNRVLLQFLFLFLLLVSAAAVLLPYGDHNIALYDAIRSGEKITDLSKYTLTSGNILVILVQFAVQIVASLTAYFYALVYIFEQDMEAKEARTKALAQFLASLAQTLLLALIIFVVAIVSAALFFIPALFFAFSFLFIPLEIATQKEKLPLILRMKAAFTLMRGKRFFAFISFLFSSILINLAEGIFLQVVGEGMGASLLSSFFFALATLINARLYVKLYSVIYLKNLI